MARRIINFAFWLLMLYLVLVFLPPLGYCCFYLMDITSLAELISFWARVLILILWSLIVFLLAYLCLGGMIEAFRDIRGRD